MPYDPEIEAIKREIELEKAQKSGYNKIKVFDLQLFGGKDLPKQTLTQLNKGVRSYKKQIERHEWKIKKPEQIIPNWARLDSGVQRGIIGHWEHEIEIFNQNMQDNLNEIKRRGGK